MIAAFGLVCSLRVDFVDKLLSSVSDPAGDTVLSAFSMSKSTATERSATRGSDSLTVAGQTHAVAAAAPASASARSRWQQGR